VNPPVIDRSRCVGKILSGFGKKGSAAGAAVEHQGPDGAKNFPPELIVAQLLFQPIGRQMAEDGREVSLRDGVAVLTENDVRFLVGAPCSPTG
jgi:hypothetical protein